MSIGHLPLVIVAMMLKYIYLHIYISTEKRRFAPLATLLYFTRFVANFLVVAFLAAGGAACNSVMPGRDHSRSHHFLSPKQQHALRSAQLTTKVPTTKITIFVPLYF